MLFGRVSAGAGAACTSAIRPRRSAGEALFTELSSAEVVS